jgi:RNA polymerase primary sigma factor
MDSELQMYLREINKSELLTKDEEVELGRRIRRGDLQARDEMIRCNLGLVVNIAKGYTRRGLGLLDLIGEGNLGLMKAAEKYDPTEGCRFSTYASWWIRQTIRRSLISQVKTIEIPSYMVGMVGKFRRTSIGLEAELSRPPTQGEIAGRMGLSSEKVGEIEKARNVFNGSSLAVNNFSEWALAEVIADGGNSPLNDSLYKERIGQVMGVLNKLDSRAREILELRYGLGNKEPMTLKEVGKYVGLTKQRVKQIESGVLLGIQDHVENGIPLEEALAKYGAPQRKYVKTQKENNLELLEAVA